MPESLTCHRCKLSLESARVDFDYMGHTFHIDLPRCPGCRQVFISEDLAKGRMADVEMELEDK